MRRPHPALISPTVAPSAPAGRAAHAMPAAPARGVAALAFLAMTLATGAALAQQAPAAGAAPAAAGAPAAPVRVLRAEVSTPLQAAQTALREDRLDEAVVRVEAAAAVAGLTAFERVAVERMRAAVAFRQGRFGTAAVALEAALDTGEMAPGADTNEIMASVVDLAMRERDYPRVLRWSQRYLEAGGSNDSVSVLRLEALRLSGDEASALQGWKLRREAADRAGTKMPESHMRVMWALIKRLESSEQANAAMERLAQAYPRGEYFADLVATAATGELLDRDLLQLYRLLRASGYLNRAPVVMEMAQTSLRAGLPGEARSVLEEAQKAGVLAAVPAAELAKLREDIQRALAADERDRAAAEADARRAADGNRLADLGWIAVSALPPGAPPEQVLPGLTMIEQALAKGDLKREVDVRLQLGMAQLAAGRREEARRTLEALARQTAGSPERVATAARLWSLYAAVPAFLPPRN